MKLDIQHPRPLRVSSCELGIPGENVTVYHITSRPTKQAFLGPITKLVPTLAACHTTSRIEGI